MLTFDYTLKLHINHTRYEDLLEDQAQTIKSILRGRGLYFDKDSNTTNTTCKPPDRTFQKIQKYYLTQEYLKLFTSKDIFYSVKKLNKKLETRIFGYEIPPNGAWPWVEEERAHQSGFMVKIWNFAMMILWWIVVPTIALLLLFTPFLVWIRCKQDGRILQERKQTKNRERRRRMINTDPT